MQEAASKFRAKGFGFAAMTYDSQAVLRAFADRHHITYPLLADPESVVIGKMRLIDPDNGPANKPDYAKKNMAYAGYFRIDRGGIVRERFFGDRYFDRFSANHVVGRMFPQLLEARSRVDAPHIVAEIGQSDREVILGTRVALVVDLTIPRGTHIYSSNVTGYQPLALNVDKSNVRIRGIQYPPADREITFEFTKEKLPVHDKRARIVADVMVMLPAEMQQRFDGHGHDEIREPMPIKAELKYQACTEQVCYPPATVPLEWTVFAHPMNIERVPEGVREKPAPEVSEKRVRARTAA